MKNIQNYTKTLEKHFINKYKLHAKVWKKVCMSNSQYSSLVFRHLCVQTWYQLCMSLTEDHFNPFRRYVPHMIYGCVRLLSECLKTLLVNVREMCIQRPSILQLSQPPTVLFNTEWLFRCCVSLRNDRHGSVPQGLLPRLFRECLLDYCYCYANVRRLPLGLRTVRWFVHFYI